MVLNREQDALDLTDVERDRVLCASGNVLGNGRRDGIRDVVVVDVSRYDRAAARETAREVARINADLVKQRVPYLLIGVGRWGSADPWLGIPVTWEQILGARVIVEAELADLTLEPSQGSHFFQNLTSFQVGYFTVRDGQARRRLRRLGVAGGAAGRPRRAVRPSPALRSPAGGQDERQGTPRVRDEAGTRARRPG